MTFVCGVIWRYQFWNYLLSDRGDLTLTLSLPKFHFRIFRHGFLISKHVRAGMYGILAPAVKAET